MYAGIGSTFAGPFRFPGLIFGLLHEVSILTLDHVMSNQGSGLFPSVHFTEPCLYQCPLHIRLIFPVPHPDAVPRWLNRRPFLCIPSQPNSHKGRVSSCRPTTMVVSCCTILYTDHHEHKPLWLFISKNNILSLFYLYLVTKIKSLK